MSFFSYTQLGFTHRRHFPTKADREAWKRQDEASKRSEEATRNGAPSKCGRETD